MNENLYKTALLDLIAYCQREGVLSTGEKVTEELSDILWWAESDVDEYLFD